MTLNALPRTGLVLFKDAVECDLGSIAFGLVGSEKFAVVSHASCHAWLKDFYADNCSKATFVEFAKDGDVDVAKLRAATDRFVVFADVDLHMAILGLGRTARLLHDLRQKFCVLALCPSCSVKHSSFQKLATLADVVVRVAWIVDGGVDYTASVVAFDRRGRPTETNEMISLVAGSRPTCFKRKKTDEDATATANPIDLNSLQTAFDIGINLKDSEKAAKDAVLLPYVVGRQENGVEIRDATRKKIRAGGQIIYEPDDADDFDDSDPDDDLNI